jgi:hypothetical protein
MGTYDPKDGKKFEYGKYIKYVAYIVFIYSLIVMAKALLD